MAKPEISENIGKNDCDTRPGTRNYSSLQPYKKWQLEGLLLFLGGCLASFQGLTIVCVWVVNYPPPKKKTAEQLSCPTDLLSTQGASTCLGSASAAHTQLGPATRGNLLCWKLRFGIEICNKSLWINPFLPQNRRQRPDLVTLLRLLRLLMPHNYATTYLCNPLRHPHRSPQHQIGGTSLSFPVSLCTAAICCFKFLIFCTLSWRISNPNGFKNNCYLLSWIGFKLSNFQWLISKPTLGSTTQFFTHTHTQKKGFSGILKPSKSCLFFACFSLSFLSF